MVCPYRIEKEKSIVKTPLKFPENGLHVAITEMDLFPICQIECPFFDEWKKECKRAKRELLTLVKAEDV